jgi:hypothetical protein
LDEKKGISTYNIYEGNVYEDELKGISTYKSYEGNIYEGDWDEKKGIATYKRNKNTIYEGDIYEGDWDEKKGGDEIQITLEEIKKTSISLTVGKTQTIKNVREISKIRNRNIDDKILIFEGIIILFYIYLFICLFIYLLIY